MREPPPGTVARQRLVSARPLDDARAPTRGLAESTMQTMQPWADVFGGQGGRLPTAQRPQSSRVAVTSGAPPGTIVGVQSVGPSVRILRVVRPSGWEFAAGQHTKLGLPSAASRRYSIASPPHHQQLVFCIRLVPGGRLTPSLFTLHMGGRLQVAARAKGQFQLNDGADVHVMVATGTGIAPFRSMLLDTFERRDGPQRFVVVHGGSYADDLPFADELSDLATRCPQLTYVPTISRPAELRNRGWSGRSGRADEVLRELLSSTPLGSRAQVYACGNRDMIENVRRAARRIGAPVATERFY